MTAADQEFSIAANVVEVDKVLRKGAKVWLTGGWMDGSYERVMVLGLSRGGRRIEKWLSLHKLDRFRAAWVPEAQRPDVQHFRGAKEEMQVRADALSVTAERLRSEHPNRQFVGGDS